jgi:hypothetical protein
MEHIKIVGRLTAQMCDPELWFLHMRRYCYVATANKKDNTIMYFLSRGSISTWNDSQTRICHSTKRTMFKFP